MEDFNNNNLKIEAALEGVTALCNCQIYLTPYTGTGEAEARTFIFPHRPMAVLILGTTGTWACGIRDFPALHVCLINSYYGPSITWGDNSISFGGGSYSAAQSCNSSSKNYLMAAFLDAAN